MRFFFFLLFFSVLLLSKSQEYSHSDTSLWDSPLTPKQVLRAGIKQLISKSTGWCSVQCSAPWYGTRTTHYKYDEFGYPVFLSAQNCRQTSEFVSENTYSNGHLVRSVLKQNDYLFRIFEQSFNSKNLPDSCSWIMNGQDDRATAYTYDSLSRIAKTNYYSAFGGTSFSLKKEVEEFYNTDNLPSHVISTSHTGAEWQKMVWRYNIRYRKKFRVHKVIT
jgi:hypothetical protein